MAPPDAYAVSDLRIRVLIPVRDTIDKSLNHPRRVIATSRLFSDDKYSEVGSCCCWKSTILNRETPEAGVNVKMDLMAVLKMRKKNDAVSIDFMMSNFFNDECRVIELEGVTSPFRYQFSQID